MFIVIFEVHPRPDRWDDYLRYAKWLTPELEQIDGFIDNERFRSRRRDGWAISLSTWRDEKALIRWRTLAAHHGMQEKGRAEVFDAYRLRVGEIIADTQWPDGHVPPGQRFDVTEVGRAKIVTVTARTPAHAAAGPLGEPRTAVRVGDPGDAGPTLVEWDVCEGITRPGALLWLHGWSDAEAARAWLAGASQADHDRTVRVIRDYGLIDRVEAPQYYPPVSPPEVG